MAKWIQISEFLTVCLILCEGSTTRIRCSMDSTTSDVLVQLTTLEEETRHARERFQKTLDDIADQNHITRSPRINGRTMTGNTNYDVSDEDVNNLLRRLELRTKNTGTSPNFFSPMTVNASNVIGRGSGEEWKGMECK